jgi:glycosyltransferase involved in cell wall biosynthesis
MNQIKNKKIAFLILSDPHIYPPTINAANFMAEKGYQVYLYGIEYKSTKDKVKLNPKIKLKYFGQHQVGIRNVLQFFSIIIKFSFESIIHNFKWIISYDPFSVIPAYTASKLINTKWNYHQHDFWEKPFGVFQTVLYKLEYLLGSKANLVSFPQQHRAKIFMERSKMKYFPPLIYNGPRLSWINNAFIEIHPTLKELKLRFDFIIIYQGGLSKYFCIDNLIKSIPLSNHQFCLVLLGKELENGIKSELTNLAKSLGVVERVVFWKDYVPYDELPNITSYCDIGIAKLTHTQMDAPINDQFIAGASNKLIEYLACGLPIITSDTEDNKSFFSMDKIGILCNPSESQNIANSIDQLLGSNELRLTMSKHNKRQFVLKYNFDQQFEKVYMVIDK